MSFHFGITLKNFKIFKEEVNLEFAPITVLTGTNGSGKTTINQALRMLKDRVRLTVDYLEPNKIPLQELVHYIHNDTLDKKISDVRNLKNINSGSNEFEIGAPLNIKNYKYPCSGRFVYEIEGNNIKKGTVKEFYVYDLHHQIKLYSLSTASIQEVSRKYTAKINYLAFYENLMEVKTDIINFQNWAKKKGLSPEEFKTRDKKILEYAQEIIGEQSLYKYGKNSKDNYMLELPYELTEFGDYYFQHSRKIINKTVRDIDSKLYDINPEDLLFDFSNLFDDEEQESNLYMFLVNVIEESETPHIDLNKYLLEILSNKAIEVAEVNAGGAISYEHNLSEKIQIPTLALKNFLFDKLGHETEPDAHDIIRMLTENAKNWNKNSIELTESGVFFFKNLFTRDLSNAIQEFIGRNNSLYHFENAGSFAESRVINLNENAFSKKVLTDIMEGIPDPANEEIKFLTKWIREFGIADNLKTETFENYCKVILTKKNTDFNIADEGLGVGKVIPILLTILHIYKSNIQDHFGLPFVGPTTLIVEEPETGLHPALQSKLADMFWDAYKKFNIQFMIETHSEYLVRKLQYLTAKGLMNPEETALYYFNHPNEMIDGNAQVKRIHIKSNGALSDNFGPGFLDVTDNIAMEIFFLNKEQQN